MHRSVAALLIAGTACSTPEPTPEAAHAAPVLPPPVFTVSRIEEGTQMTAEVRGLPRNTPVVFFLSAHAPAPGPCHPTVPLCLGITKVVNLGTVRTNRQGVATRTLWVPDEVQPSVVWLQAAALGTVNATSPIVQRTVFDYGSDTFRFDTDPDDTVTDSSPANVRAGLHTEGQLLRMSGMVVTAVRYRTSPVASNGIVVQDPTVGINGGIYVHLGGLQALPSPGDVVTVTGAYEEWGIGTPRFETRSRLLPNLDDPTSLEVTGVMALPDAVPFALDDLDVPAAAEPYESMLVTLTGAGPFVVQTDPNGTTGEFTVSDGTSTGIVDAEFVDLRDLHQVDVGDSFTGLTGVLTHDINAYKVAPNAATSAEGYVEHP